MCLFFVYMNKNQVHNKLVDCTKISKNGCQWRVFDHHSKAILLGSTSLVGLMVWVYMGPFVIDKDIVIRQWGKNGSCI